MLNLCQSGSDTDYLWAQDNPAIIKPRNLRSRKKEVIIDPEAKPT